MTIDEFLSKRGSQALIATKMGMSRQRVGQWVTQKRRPNTYNLIKLSKVLTELGVDATPAQVLEWFNKDEKK